MIRKIHIVGIVGVPASYGGFETLTEQLLDSKFIINKGVTVYCEKSITEANGIYYKGAKVVSLPWRANGWQSVFFDALGIFKASQSGACVLILGTSSTFLLPLFRLALYQPHHVHCR